MAVAISIATTLSAQDIIIFTNGSEHEAKIVEVSDAEVKYKTWNNLEGPTWVKKTNDIFMIKYENGTKQVFEKRNVPQQANPSYSHVAESDMEPTYFRKTIPASVSIGAKVRWGFNVMRLSLSSPGYASEGYGLTRYPLSYGANVDFFKKQDVAARTYDSLYTIFGFTLGAVFTNRGGTNGTMYYGQSTTFNVSYFALRPGLAIRPSKGNASYGAVRFGFELGIFNKLLVSLEANGTENIDCTEQGIVNKLSYGSFVDFDIPTKYGVTLGGYIEFAAPIFKKDAFGTTISSESWNLALGVSIGYEFKSIRLN